MGQEVQEVELGEEEKEPAAHMSQSEPRCDWASPAGHPTLGVTVGRLVRV